MAEKFTYTVKWIMAEKKLIKFLENSDDFKLSDKVAKLELEKLGIKNGVKVNVEIVNKEVVYLSKEDEKNSQEALKGQPESQIEAEQPTLDNKTVFTWKVKGITDTKSVMSFYESAVKWYIVPETLIPELDKLGIKARSVVNVTFTTVQEKGKEKPAIATIALAEVKEEPKEQAETSPTTGSDKSYDQYKNKNSTGTSIEHQVALKGAVDIVAALITAGQVKKDEAKNFVSELTKQFISDIV